MALTVDVEDGGLLFRSAGYFLQFGKLRIMLPQWFHGCKLTVSHVELGQGQFHFILDISHAMLGEFIHQKVLFGDIDAR